MLASPVCVIFGRRRWPPLCVRRREKRLSPSSKGGLHIKMDLLYIYIVRRGMIHGGDGMRTNDQPSKANACMRGSSMHLLYWGHWGWEKGLVFLLLSLASFCAESGVPKNDQETGDPAGRQDGVCYNSRKRRLSEQENGRKEQETRNGKPLVLLAFGPSVFLSSSSAQQRHHLGISTFALSFSRMETGITSNTKKLSKHARPFLAPTIKRHSSPCPSAPGPGSPAAPPPPAPPALPPPSAAGRPPPRPPHTAARPPQTCR